MGAYSYIKKYRFFWLALCLALWAGVGVCDDASKVSTLVRTNLEGTDISVRNVDFSRFPEISMVLDVHSVLKNEQITKDNIEVFENNYLQQVISLEKIVIKDKIPVDFVFVLDKTGSMK